MTRILDRSIIYSSQRDPPDRENIIQPPAPPVLTEPISILRQSRRYYDCWPLKGACPQSVKVKILHVLESWCILGRYSSWRKHTNL